MGGLPLHGSLSEEDALKQFVHCVTHDVRSPLVNIRALSGEIRRSLPIPAAGARTRTDFNNDADLAFCNDIAETLGHIDACVLKMDRTMNQLVRYAQAGYRPLTLQRVDPHALLTALFEKESNILAEQGVRVQLCPLPAIDVDPLALEWIFGELLANSLKFALPDRPLVIDVSGEEEADRLNVRFSDNGRGIAAGDLEKVFAPLRRSGKAGPDGEGIGLAVVRTLMRRQEGAIACQSTLGEGTSFTLQFQLFNEGQR